MNKDTFIKLFKTPAPISVPEIEALDEVLKSFPYCQSAHILLAKANYDKGSMFANQKVKKAALFISSREKLKEVITANSSLTVSDTKQEQIKTVEISTIELLQPAVEIDNSVFEKVLQKEKTIIAATTTPIIEEKTIVAAKPLEHSDNTALLEEIQQTLISIKKKQALIEEKETDTKKITTPSAAENLRNDIEAADELHKKKTIPESEISTGLKFYVHIAAFGKDIRPVKEDLIAEYLTYRPSTFTPKPPIEAQLSIIQKFIEDSPQISRFNDIGGIISKVDLSKNSTVEDSELVSENLANIFTKQGKYKKAIEVYEKLKLKYPDKTAYFAEKIEYINSLNK